MKYDYDMEKLENQIYIKQNPNNQLYCNSCGKSIASDSKFCGYCGQTVKRKEFCINCGKEILKNSKNFCREKRKGTFYCV